MYLASLAQPCCLTMGILQQVQGSFGYPFYQEEVEELSSLEVITVIVMAAKMLVCRDLAPNMA